MPETNFGEHWEVIRLEEIADVRAGSAFPIKYQGNIEGKHPFYKVSDMNLTGNETLMHASNNWVEEDTVKTLKAKLFPKDTVIFPKVGAAVHTNKKRILSTNGLVDNNVMGVTIRNYNLCIPYYLLYWFEFIDLGDLSNPGPLPAITATTVKNTKIPLPPLPEQRAITHVLQTIQEAKFARQREIALECERKAALMDYLFSRGTKGEPRKKTEIGDIPESWKVVQTGEIGKIVTGNTPKTSVPEYYGGPYMFISPGDISEPQYVTKTNKYVSAEGLKVLRPLPRDSVLVVCIGSTIGKTAMTSAEQSATNQQINAIIPKAKAFSHYVYYAVTYRSRNLPALAGRAAVPIVKKSSFAKFLIPFPPISEQHTIANIFRAIDEKTAALEQEVVYLDELFHAMLDELMTGQRSAVPLIDIELSDR